MFRKIQKSLPALLIVGICAISGLNAALATSNSGPGLHIAFVDKNGNTASQMYVSGGKVRLESGDQSNGGAIYDAGTHSLTVLMPERQAYMVLDQQSAAEMGSQMQAAEKRIQAKMANLPPEQRAMMEKMMGPNGAMGSNAKITVKDLGSSETVAGHQCKDMQVVVNDNPGLKMCVTPMTSLDIPANVIATLEHMRTDMLHIMSSMGPMAQAYSSLENSQGFAIKRDVPHREGLTLVTSTEILKSITRETPAASLFEIPAGYKQTSIKDMMRHGG